MQYLRSIGYSYSSPTKNFCVVPPHCLDWSYRLNLILRYIVLYNPDVVCLQEVDHFTQMESKLTSAGYIGDFMLRKETQVHHGVALFFKASKFDLLDTFNEYLNEEDGNVGNQGLLVKLLKEKKSGKQVIVGNVHQKAKRPFHERRWAQTKSALKVFEKILAKYNDIPVVWAGDFNGETTEMFHKEISDSSIGFKSSYEEILGKEPEFTTWKIRPTYEERHTIDYIWYTKEKLNVSDILLPMEDADVPKTRYPSLDHPSDHIALCTDFKFL